MSRRVLIGDGAMGTMLQAADLTLDDFNGLEGCNDPQRHPARRTRRYPPSFEAGADAVETNTFGCNLSNLGDYDIADCIRELSYKGTAIARGVADEMGASADGTPVSCSVPSGPGPNCRAWATPRSRSSATPTECVAGMLDGGADAILIETSQDLLQVKAAVVAARHGDGRAGPVHPDHLPM